MVVVSRVAFISLMFSSMSTLFVQLFANLLKLLNVDSVFSDSLLVPKIIRIKTLRKQIDGNAGRF